jgi:hypothetical protein
MHNSWGRIKRDVARITPRAGRIVVAMHDDSWDERIALGRITRLTERQAVMPWS